MKYQIQDNEGNYLNTFNTFDEAYDENERLRRVYPNMKTVVVVIAEL